MHSVVDAPGDQVLLDHQRHLEGDGVVKLPQVQSGELFDLLQPVDERIQVDEKLSRCHRNIQAVFKKFINCRLGFFVKLINGISGKYFFQEHLA